MSDIPCLFSDTTSSVRRTQALERSNYGQFSHGHGGNPLRILGAESYLDGNTLSIAQSLTELAQRPAHDMPTGSTVRYDENAGTSGTVTPPILKARQAEVELNRNSKRRKGSGAQAQEMARERIEKAEDDQPAKKRRKRRSSEDDDGGYEAEKKTRGRPRLDTKDESASDRRRTQIRMAQRAYRNRKETTITSLEKQVEKLQSMTEEMSNALIGLYDLAMTKGLLRKDPEFGQQFLRATQRFLALAKSAGGHESNHREDSVSPCLGAAALPTDQDATATTQRQDTHPDKPLPSKEKSRTLTTNSVWGYEITHAPQSDDPAYSTHRWYEELPTPPPKRPEHEITARATEQNASFPFDMYHYDELPSTSMIQTDYQVNYATINETPTYQSCMQPTAPLNPWIQPVFYGSYAHQESSFGRRLHRTIIERGYQLLMNPHKSPQIFKRVFGLSLKLYPKNMLAEAMHRVILRMKSEPLSQWDLPFISLGGSGTHFPPTSQEECVVPKVGTGRSIGPVTEIVSGNMEKYLLDNYRGKVPGFEGVWFDTYDVESYLQKKGIHIPPDVEWLTVDLNKINLGEVAVAARMITSLGSSSEGTTATPSNPESPYLNSLGLTQRQQIMKGVDASLEFVLAGTRNENTANSHMAPFVIDSTEEGNFNSITDKLFSGTTHGTTFDFSTSPSETDSDIQCQRLITFSVTRLLEAILRKGICLGRAAGFRPSDVDKALRQTIQEAS